MATHLPSIAMRRRLRRSCTRAATEIGQFVAPKHRHTPRPANRKGEGDFVTATDIASERQLRRLLLDEYPEHGFVGEETPPLRPDADFVWIVDPIDGTSNFTQGLPVFAVAIACMFRGRPIAAAVHCMPEGVVYTAAAGCGATRAGRKLRVPKSKLDDASVLGVQWHRGARAELGFVQDLVDTGARIRVIGSTVAQLCDVATGRLHANMQEQGRVWDFAAAGLIVTEAGGRITDWDGRSLYPIEDLTEERHYPTLAAGPRIHRELRKQVLLS